VKAWDLPLSNGEADDFIWNRVVISDANGMCSVRVSAKPILAPAVSMCPLYDFLYIRKSDKTDGDLIGTTELRGEFAYRKIWEPDEQDPIRIVVVVIENTTVKSLDINVRRHS
jgi:hypothetical protein